MIMHSIAITISVLSMLAARPGSCGEASDESAKNDEKIVDYCQAKSATSEELKECIMNPQTEGSPKCGNRVSCDSTRDANVADD